MLRNPISYTGQVAAVLLAMPRYKEQALTPETGSRICSFVAVDHSVGMRFENIELRKITSWLQPIGTLEVANT
jgi:hypothetical protein